MGRQSSIVIKESRTELKKLYNKHQKEKPRKQLRVLMSIQENKYSTQEELSAQVGISYATFKRWIKKYKEFGIKEFLSDQKRDKKSKFLTATINESLDERLNSDKDCFTSYVEIQSWLASEFDCKIKYQNLYYLLTKRKKTKLKVPRKSNIKKDERAAVLFKNATIKD